MDLTKSPTQVGLLWCKRWLERQENLFKVGKKATASANKDAQDPDIMIRYFKIYKEMVDKFEILQEDK